MPTYSLLATPPESRLLAAIDRVLRTGITGIPDSQPDTAWAAGAPCPAGHAVFPTGLRIYRHDVAEEVDAAAPAIVLYIEEQPQRCVDSWEGLWKIAVKVDLLWDRDLWDSDEGEAIVSFVKNLLTNDIQTPSSGISRACARLTDSGFLAVGTIEENNFAGGMVDRLQTNEGHPYVSIGFRLTCGGISA
jgi:hypothetical protein